MRCPVLSLVCGLEQVAGFSELVERLPAEQVRKRMGQRFPLVPDLIAAEVPEKVEDAVEVVTGNLFPSMIHSMFLMESKGVEELDEVLRANTQLFRLLQGIVERGERMARLVKDCIPTLRGEPVMFGGCYFAGTGRDSGTEQAFASGVPMRMIKEDQDSVTWTEEAMDQDAAAARLAGRIRLALIAIITLGVLAGAGMIAQRFLAKPSDPSGRDVERKLMSQEPDDLGVQSSRRSSSRDCALRRSSWSWASASGDNASTCCLTSARQRAELGFH